MKKTKILSMLIAILLVFTSVYSASAATFEDVPAIKYSWAVGAISSMSEKGIIKGYEDGTFKPERTVTKLEALVLTARVLGFDVPENEALLNAAIETYGEEVSKYKLNYGQDEISYLIIKNVISVDDLDEYIGKDNASSGMKRYEIAVLLTKALDADEEVSKIVITSLEYADATEIPTSAKKYVEYVTNNGIMNGMEDNKFSPKTDVTRAQAAVLFNKLLGITKYTYTNGLVESLEPDTKSIKIKNDDKISEYTINDSVFLRFEGSKITIDDIATGYDSVVTLKDGSLYAIDFVTPLIDLEMYAYVESTSSEGTPSVTVYEIAEEDTSVSKDEKISFKLADNCSIKEGKDTASFDDISSGNYVKLNVKQGKIKTINILSKTETVSGTVSDIEITPVCKFIVELTDGETEEYVLGDDVTVSKNGSKSTASDILSGDSVTITTTYGKITKIVATSETQEKGGIITEVVISANPRLTIKSGEEETTFKVTKNCIFTLAGKPNATFYDLRVGTPATIVLESDTVIEIKSEVTEDITQVSGTVVSVSESYAVIQVTYVDSVSGNYFTEPVFVKDKATIVDIATGNTLKLTNVTPGSKITAFGSRNTGVFEATIVNVSTN